MQKGIKKPLSAMGQGRNRGTTLHYTLKAYSVTGTPVLIYWKSVQSGSSRVIVRRLSAPAFTIRRLSGASRLFPSRSQHVLV